MKLWQCSLCGKVGLWGPGWTAFSSFIVDDEWPSHRVVVCSDACADKANEGHKAGTIQLPKFKRNGPMSRMTRGPVGYKPQPEQSTLIRIWNEQHPNDQLRTEFAR
jgi:hypothetical protein